MRLPGNEPNVSILESKSVLPSFSIAVYPCVSVSLVIVADSSLHLHSHTVCPTSNVEEASQFIAYCKS